MTDKIIVEMHAYNAEKTIGRAIESVLNQTHGNLVLHVLDNASTDNTLNIIRQYAGQDERVVVYHFGENDILRWMSSIVNVIFARDYSESTWYASLSADDEYDVTCFEKLLRFASDNDLDIASCRSQFIGDVDNRVYNKRIEMKGNLIIEGDDFGNLFPEYWRYFQANWGHIIRIPDEAIINVGGTGAKFEFGGDNRFMLGMLKMANKVGVLNEFLHKYYIHETALSTRYTEDRYKSSERLFGCMYEYIDTKAGYVSLQNEMFLFQKVYLRILMNSFPVICQADIADEKRWDELLYMIKSDVTRRMLETEYISEEEKRQCFQYLYDFLHQNTFQNIRSDEARRELEERLAEIYGE